MASASLKEPSPPTLGGLYRRFGAIRFDRIRTEPAPGTATEDDVVAIESREGLLYELVDGILVRKVMAAHESYLATQVSTFLNAFVRPRRLGAVLGADGMIRLNPGLVRIPDVSFIALDRLPGGRMPRDAICPIVPDLAVEVLSKGNTRKEIAAKLEEYFQAGVRLVWLVEPESRSVRVHEGPGTVRVVGPAEVLEGGEVLPGFRLAASDIFAEPGE